jgi:uncharacterized protein
MSLYNTLQEDLKSALKRKDQFTVDVLRFLNAAFQNKLIEERAQNKNFTLSDDDIQTLLLIESKKRIDAIEAFTKGGRVELAEKEQKELLLIRKYLPEQMDEKAIQTAVTKIISEIKPQDFGSAMKVVMNELRGKADAKFVTLCVRKELEKEA